MRNRANLPQRVRSNVLLLILATAASAVAAADQASPADIKPPPTEFKLTTSWYRASDRNHANDINLRGRAGDHTAWVGIYRDHQSTQQMRTGYEFTQRFDTAQIVWSVQAAGGGFVGSSVNAQIGDATYAIAGFGRTNLRNYYNLNFDPNDAITIGVGHHLNSDTDVSLYQVRDDRLPTRQRMTHLYLHQNLSDGMRYSIDASYKSGLNSDGNFITGYGLTVTLAQHDYFVRLAHDPYANFGSVRQTRVSLGKTF